MLNALWKTEKNKTDCFELVPYIKRFLVENINYDVRIYVGTDSQSLKRFPNTGYVTCVAFHLGTMDDSNFYGHGVHAIYREFKTPKIRDTFRRLWKEVDATMHVAERIRNSGIHIHCIDLDFNQNKIYESNRLIAAAEGLFKGLGYNVSSKPDELFATCAADSIIHKINWKSVPLISA